MYYCKDDNVNYYRQYKKSKFEASEQYKNINLGNAVLDILAHLFSILFLALFLIVGYLYITKQNELLFKQVRYVLSSNSTLYTTHYPIYLVKSQKTVLKKEEIARIDRILTSNHKRPLLQKRVLKKNSTRVNNVRTIVVQKGDTLYTLAERAYGNASYYQLIFDANPNVLKSKKDLYIGQVLRIPF